MLYHISITHQDHVKCPGKTLTSIRRIMWNMLIYKYYKEENRHLKDIDVCLGPGIKQIRWNYILNYIRINVCLSCSDMLNIIGRRPGLLFSNLFEVSEIQLGDNYHITKSGKGNRSGHLSLSFNLFPRQVRSTFTFLIKLDRFCPVGTLIQI